MKLLSFFWIAISCAYLTAESQIKHRFVASDESAHQVIHVDEKNPEKNWQVPMRTRDMQLIGNDQLMVSVKHGYKVLSLKDGSTVKEFKSDKFKSVNSVRRLKDGRTFLFGNAKSNPVAIQVLDKKDQEQKLILVDKKIKDVRLARISSEETFFLGFSNKLFEVDAEGAIVMEKEIAGGRHIYKAVRTKKGNTYVASGYGSSVNLYDKEGELKLAFGKQEGQAPKGADFFADFQILRNGHIVVCNWMGHGRQDSKKGDQLVQFDRKGNVVWSWHDPEMAGCLHGLIVLDGLDTKKYHNEQRGLLAPVK